MNENELQKLANQFPLIDPMIQGLDVFWRNSDRGSYPVSDLFSMADIEDADARLHRFAPFLSRVFPDTQETGGIIESPLIRIDKMKAVLSDSFATLIDAELLLKCDSHLPVSGSIKARGGIYEVLKFAEEIAQKSGMLSPSENYAILGEERFKDLFSQYTIAVGSTGNLGLSIGIISAALGFRSEVHMSSDARRWKKDLLRSKGVSVIEYAGSYELAVASGRTKAKEDAFCHFVDDENSADLFLGYATAAIRLKKQLEVLDIPVDEAHPLFIYLPCGVGGGPGGITFGLKQVFGDFVHCYFAEPVQAPCMLLGLMTGKWDRISVDDIGLSGKTAADGLAVKRPSRLVCQVMTPLLDGCFTVQDRELFKCLWMLAKSEQLYIEPSACAGFPGIFYTGNCHSDGTHIVWATGGNMVPQDEMEQYFEITS